MACKYDQPEVVEYMLTELHINLNEIGDHHQSILSIAKSKEVIKLLLQHGAVAKDAYTYHRKVMGKVFSKEPLKSPLRMFVVGDGGEGKSTLIEAMEHEPTVVAPLVSIFVAPKEVDGVSKRTAGIVPRVFKSRFYGEVLFYDFAGQESYYSSHAAIIRSAVDTCPPTFILVVGIHRDDTAIEHSVSYWLGIITNQCTKMESKAPLVVVCSHPDLVNAKVEINRKKDIIHRTTQKFSSFNLVGIIQIDCRYSNSSGMKSLRRCVGKCCDLIQSKLSISLNSHMFLIYLLEKHASEAAFTLEKIQVELKGAINQTQKVNQLLPFIPTTIPHLVEICTQLNDKGHILFLPDNILEKSFIIINKMALLAEINGTIFAPEDFKQHCQLATSTGVVPRSKLAEHFPKFDITMLIKFLAHFELAIPINDEEVIHLVNQHLGKSAECDRQEFLFCPALIRLKVPPHVFVHQAEFSFNFGWLLSCMRTNDFLDARFLHVLILRLALSLGIAPAKDPDFPALQHHCSVWKTGVCWYTSDGIKVLVEVINKKRVVVLIQAHKYSVQSLMLRSDVINKVRKTASEFCPSVVTEEFLLSCADVIYPINVSTTPVFSLKSAAQTVVHKKPFVLATTGSSMLPLNDILSVEVYANLGKQTLHYLHNESYTSYDVKVSDSFLGTLQSSWSENAQLVPIVHCVLTEAIKTTPQRSSENLGVFIKTWREQSEGTYRSLKQVLDPLSVFAGKNPLVSS